MASVGNPIGGMIGMYMGPQFISETKRSLMPLKREIEEVENYVFWHAIFDTAMCLPFLICFKERPKYYPEKSSESERNKKYSIKKDL